MSRVVSWVGTRRGHWGYSGRGGAFEVEDRGVVLGAGVTVLGGFLELSFLRPVLLQAQMARLDWIFGLGSATVELWRRGARLT
jgi:hypothetical protein